MAAEQSDLLYSPLDRIHKEHGARMVPFAGWSMPVAYKSIVAEHQAVRTDVGVFDISHMGQLWVSGPAAEDWLNRMLTNDVRKLDIGRGQYTFLLNEQGGVLDDLLIYREQESRYLLVVNASKTEEDEQWLRKHLADGVELRNESRIWAAMAVQGSRSRQIFEEIFPDETLPKRNRIHRMKDGSYICRTGYTGEDGFEYFCAAEKGAEVYQKILDADVTPCGLGARDSLRLEMCYPLNGNDLMPDRTPLEAGLGFFVALKKGDFIGREPLQKQKEQGCKEVLTAIEYQAKAAPPRAGYGVFLRESEEQIAELSSGGPSPTLGKGIAMAYLPLAHTKHGTLLDIDVRGRKIPAIVVKKPFYKPNF